ncbi:MAG TPA: hypothetical protein DCX07_02385 [Phycisphaerales bacterium]|nr:hypothetical protein [Phycisphaerales bacterium]
MNAKFRKYVDSLHPSFEKLMAMPPVPIDDLPAGVPKCGGIYLLSERGKPLYVGHSNHICQRLQQHRRLSSTHNSASFAFLLARKKTGMKPSYKISNSRKMLESNRVFREAFEQAKKRVRRMRVQYVEEPNPMRQALLEMYVAVALSTPYNSFETH